MNESCYVLSKSKECTKPQSWSGNGSTVEISCLFGGSGECGSVGELSVFYDN